RLRGHAIKVFDRSQLEKSTVALFLFSAFSERRFFPCLAGKFVKRDPAPAQPRARRGIITVKAHVHENLVTGFQFANLAQRDVVRETDEPGHAFTAPAQSAGSGARGD